MSDYKLVPVEPTIEMLAELGFNGDYELAVGHAAICADLEARYRAMLAAAPAVQGEPVEALYECIAEARDACLDDDHWMCRDKLMGVLDGIQQLINKESK